VKGSQESAYSFEKNTLFSTTDKSVSACERIGKGSRSSGLREKISKQRSLNFSFIPLGAWVPISATVDIKTSEKNKKAARKTKLLFIFNPYC
jgi:hypothetical protein